MSYSLQALKTLRARLPSSIPLIGRGGILSGTDALEYARAGASLVQVYTSFGMTAWVRVGVLRMSSFRC